MQPECNRIDGTGYQLQGRVAAYLDAVTRQWLLVAPEANPAMLDMFRDRDRSPCRDLVPWAGEFAGKYLTSAVQVLHLTRDPALRHYLAGFVRELVQLQDDDGYLGPWPRSSRLTGTAPNVYGKPGDTWDAWGHYHLLVGFLLWHDETRDGAALAAARRIGDLLCARFLGGATRLVDTGSTEMNLAPVHGLALLYRRCPEQRYLDLALQLVDEFAASGPDGPLAGDYLHHPLRGGAFHLGPKPRWESLHPIMGLAELYWITGNEEFRRAYEHTWWSIVEGDRHNNGGFSSGERAQGNPYHRGAIETCCTVAWMAASVEMLRLTGNPVIADELELSTLNSALGLMSPSGRWVTYDTPMDGVRKASAHDIVFQAREGSPELNCCSVNGPRGLGLIGDWAVMQSGSGGLYLNWYGPCTIDTRAGDSAIRLRQTTEYPREGKIHLELTLDRRTEFDLALRIPYWSTHTRLQVNEQPLDGVRPGTYHRINRHWQRGDTVVLHLDMSLHGWAGEEECRERVALYRGPLLLTYDRRINRLDPDQIPELDAGSLCARMVAGGRLHGNPEDSSSWQARPADAAPRGLTTWIDIDVGDASGRQVRLCDFASAGQGGSPYISWLPIRAVPLTPFSRHNPLRSSRISP